VDPELTGAGAIGTGAHVFNRAGIPKPRRLKRADVVSIMGSSVVRSVVQGAIERSAGPAEIGDHVAFLAAHSVMSDEGKRLGILVLGRWVDALEIEAIEQSVGAPVTIFSGKVLDVTTLPRSAARELRVGPAIRDDLRTSPGVSDQLALGSSSYFAGYAGITDGRGQVVGTIVVSPQSRLVVDTRNPVTRILFLAAMLVGAVALLLAYFSGKRITRPIQVLTSAAGAVREGDLSARAEVEGEDEVGQLGETFNEMTQSLMRFTDDLRTAARQEHDLRERIETIISSMADGLVAVDADLNILAFNPEAERITGVPAEEAAGRPFPSVVHAQGLQGEAVELPMSSLSEGLSANVFVKPRDGDRVPVAVTSAVLRDEEDEITGGVTVIRDMTREREIERMKTEFLSNISHELRTPLTPIKGYAEILGRKEVPFDKVKQFVGGILDSTVRLERIVELLVDYSALEAGRLAARAGQVDICEMLRSLATKWEARVPTHQLVVELPEDVSLEVVGDERLLRRSLEEVLDNAVKFSPDGGTVRLSARPAAGGNGSADAGMVEVSVTDQGIGIPPEDLPKIFTDFQQLDGSETRTYGGLGLGLAFVQRIVEAHKGSLRVESEPEAGTRLTISIPSAGQLLEQVEQIKD
jgi:two-component system sensor histidine kinase VicK